MKILNVDKETKKTNMEYILPIVQSGVALGLTCFLMKTGVLNYDDLVNWDNVKNTLHSIPLPSMPSLFDNGPSSSELAYNLIDKAIDTIGVIGLQRFNLAKKSFSFINDVSKPIIESDFIRTNPVTQKINDTLDSSPIVHKIREVIKVPKADAVHNTEEMVDERGTEKLKKEEKGTNSLISMKTIGQGLGIGIGFYLFGTNQLNLNSIYRWENLPHKFSAIGKMAEGIDLNKVKIGTLSISAVNLFSKANQQKGERDKQPFTPTGFKEIIGKINAEKVIPTLSSLKNTTALILSGKRIGEKGESDKEVSDGTEIRD